jgi:hypothetical protein
MRKLRMHSPIVGTGVGVIVLLISIVANKALDFLGVEELIYGIGIFIVILLGVAGIVWVIADESRQSELERIMIILKQVAPSSGFSWLYPGYSVIKLESEVKAKEIWVVSPHLLNDTGTSYEGRQGLSTIDTVDKNFKRGIAYTYIVPDIERVRTLVLHLHQTHASYHERIRVIQLPRATFQNLAISEIAIYDPNGGNPQVFMELPVMDAHTYWIKLNEEVAFPFVERVRQVIGESTAQKIVVS